MFHASLLKPVPPGMRYHIPEPAFVDDSGIPCWEVDTIIKHRKMFPSRRNCNRNSYLIAWKGFGREYDAWIDDDMLEGSPELLADYWRKVNSNPDLGTVQEPEAGSNSLQPPGRLDTFSSDEDQ